ncbi:hypothetical protein ES703_50857 [subsurface metagenome]
MKITFSPLLAGASGRAADAVAASWKGIAYIRKFVVPANPKTAAQTAVRDAFAACVTLWRSLSTTVKTFLDTYGTGYAMSGYNVFISKNRAAQQAETALRPVPDNPLISAVPDFAFDSEPDPGVSLLTWTDPEIDGYSHVLFVARDKDGVVFIACHTNYTAAAAEITIGALTIGQTYQFFLALYNPTTNVFGTSSMVEHLQAS